jgi:hypothetical protein
MKQKAIIVLIVGISFLMLACQFGGIFQPKNTSTPTLTPTSTSTTTPTVTPTPVFALECNITTEDFEFNILGESGPVEITSNGETTSYHFSNSNVDSITVEINRDMVYNDSNNSYHLEGTIDVDLTTNDLSYSITATGATFGSLPQTCQSSGNN